LTQISISGDLKSDKWEATYFIPVGFEYHSSKPFADLLIYFKTRKVDMYGLDIDIDTYYHVAPPIESIIEDESFNFNDIKALQFIFKNFADEIESIVNMSLEQLQVFHTVGYIDYPSFDEFSIANLKQFREQFDIKILY
jgi:hypothetical protein